VPKSAVARSFELMAQARANILGIALNKIDSHINRSGDYGGYYYGGGYGQRPNRNGHANGATGEMASDDEDSAETAPGSASKTTRV